MLLFYFSLLISISFVFINAQYSNPTGSSKINTIVNENKLLMAVLTNSFPNPSNETKVQSDTNFHRSRRQLQKIQEVLGVAHQVFVVLLIAGLLCILCCCITIVYVCVQCCRQCCRGSRPPPGAIALPILQPVYVQASSTGTQSQYQTQQVIKASNWNRVQAPELYPMLCEPSAPPAPPLSNDDFNANNISPPSYSEAIKKI